MRKCIAFRKRWAFFYARAPARVELFAKAFFCEELSAFCANRILYCMGVHMLDDILGGARIDCTVIVRGAVCRRFAGIVEARRAAADEAWEVRYFVSSWLLFWRGMFCVVYLRCRDLAGIK